MIYNNDIRIDQWYRIENIEIDLPIYSPLVFHTDRNIIEWREESFFNSSAGKLNIHIYFNEPQPLPHTIHKHQHVS